VLDAIQHLYSQHADRASREVTIAQIEERLQIRAEALRIERACVTTYGALVAATAGPTRRWAVEALVATAVGEAAFGGRAEPLPGLDG